MEWVCAGKVLLSIKKFQKATYKSLIPSAHFQKFLGEIVEVRTCHH
jgi:hypothetical protein